MDKKSKILIWVFIILIIGAVVASYYRYMVKKDYIVEGQTDCDPYSEECFVWQCDPEAADDSDEACTGDAEEDAWYFKVARRNAMNIPLCDPNIDEECDPWTCAEGEKDCEEIFCTEENMEEQYASACNDPAVYSEENPMDEECDSEEGDCEEAVEEECDSEEGICNVSEESNDEESAGTEDQDAVDDSEMPNEGAVE